MRLWTLHPKYLDAQGLVALWREALLARAVLRGLTTGYRRHPQLDRFRASPAPRSAINSYLVCVHAEAQVRGYKFDASKIGRVGSAQCIPASEGQLQYEWHWLLEKLQRRSPLIHQRQVHIEMPDAHPLFWIVQGPIAEWERIS